MLVGTNEHQVAFVEIARCLAGVIEDGKRNAVAARRSFERGAASGVATKPEQCEADAQAIVERATGPASLVQPDMRGASARDARRGIPREVIGGRRAIRNDDRRAVV